MYLKNLTVLGFKSFADKTTLQFMPGVSAIVGPNGCGKSNVSDAIRWVLGEQSAKALRGGEMADVIFNGTDFRKPMGMAEVSLTIGDVDEEQLRAAGVEIAYNEITVTRRVFRDGGSEYFINKTSCRLRDIQQLFMGTGVGRASYSIMAQGNITQIISSRADDRRMVFEEAAGITKFKAQKKESLRKLEHTEQNLLRVADLIKEVKRQIGSLQRQAGKARRYKQFMVDLQRLETQLARHQYDVLRAEIQERQAASEKLRTEAELCTESVARGENEIGVLRSLVSELERQIQGAQQRGHEIKSQADRHESKVHFNEERLRELDSQNAKALGDITQGEERQAAAEQELAGASERLESSTAALESHRQALNVKHEALHGIERELAQRQEAARRAQSEMFAAAQQLARARNEINALDLQKQGNIVRLEKLSSERVQLEEERARLEAKLREFAANVEEERQIIQASRGTVEQRQQRLRELQGEISRVSQELDGFLREQAGVKSRLNVLEQLQSSYEGFSAATVAVLKGAQEVLGTLTDRIRVPDAYIKAVEAALDKNLQLVLAEQPEAAREIVAKLNQNRQGRASIAALALCGAIPAGAPEAETEGALEGPLGLSAARIVEADESVRPLLNSLLGSTRIVPDLAAATQAWRECGGRHDFVTLTGELLSRHGVFTGGSGNGADKSAASALSRKNQIAELQSAAARCLEQVNDASRRKGALQSEQTELQAGLQEAQTELRSREVAIATRQGEFNALQNSLRSLGQKIENAGYEIESLTEQEDEGSRKREGLAAQMAEFEAREHSLQQQAAEAGAAIEGLRQQRDAANTELTETKVALAAEEQLRASFARQQQGLQQRLREIGALIEQRKNETASFLERRGQFEADIVESRAKIESLQHDREQVNAQLANFVSQKDEQDMEVLSREEDLKDSRRRLSDMQQRRGTLDVELAQKEMSVQNLIQRVREKYQLSLDDIQSECITITIADEGPAKVETLTPEEMERQGAATDWNAVAEQVAALQRRVDEIGPVNLVAIEEYEETEQRHQFLSTQHDDLVKAKEQLLDVINRINTQTKDMFTETFNKIRDNFRVMFTEIFGGGKADLVLVNEGDVLESGIDIVARPPGKQLQSISLLSGGEQTMTAVALLFSIYQVKPSPFCVLDELDAPLDESNINRFIRVLQRFLEHSQFVIITHNKRTIGMADVLYGVTMEEHGVSKIVSVKFHKANETPGGRSAVPLVPGSGSGGNGEENGGAGAAPEPAAENATAESEDVVMAK